MELSVEKVRCSTRWLRELLVPHKTISPADKKILADFIDEKKHGEKSLEALFNYLSRQILLEDFTVPIAVAFEEYLLLILTTAMLTNEQDNFAAHQLKCITLAKLMQFSQDARQFASNYFRNKSAPFEMNQIENMPKKKKSKKTKDTQITALDVVRCCYQLLSADLSYFKDLWNWSSFFELYLTNQKSKDVQQVYCNHIIGMLTNMTPQQLSQLNASIPTEVLMEFDAEQNIINGIPCRNPFLSENMGGELITLNIRQDLMVTNIEGVLLPIYNKDNYQFYAQSDGVYEKIVKVDSTKSNLRSIALGIAASKAICLSGAVGCGKTTLLEYLARKTGRICPKAKEVQNAHNGNKENKSHVAVNGQSLDKVGDKRKGDVDIKFDMESPVNTNGFLRIQLGDQTDSKMLLGQYRCTDVPGEFIWLPGVLTQAVMNGNWLLLEDLDSATQDTYTILSSLLENKYLSVPGFRDCVKIEPGFQLFVTVRTNKTSTNSMQKSLYTLLEKYLYTINILPLSRNELCKVVSTNYPKLTTVANRIVDVFLTFSSGEHAAADNLRQQEIGDKADTTEQYVALPFQQVSLNTLPNSGRLVSTRDLIKLCQRSNPVFSVTSMECAYFVFQNAVDIFCAYLPQNTEKTQLITSIGAKLGIIQSRCVHFANEYRPHIELHSARIKVGRAEVATKNDVSEIMPDESFSNKRQKLSEMTEKTVKSTPSTTTTTFSFTRLASCILERIAVCVSHAEPVLLVGETGVGKTSSVQYLAARTKHKLVVINMNNQSDVSDLVGGFKPVDLTYVLMPLRSEFETLFRSTFNESKNALFLQKYAICYNQGNFEVLVKLMLKVIGNLLCKKEKNLLGSKEHELFPRWLQLHAKLVKLNAQLTKSVNISFAFIPGSLVNCIKNGDWVLLDEINLASAETLECLSTILEPDGSVVLLEKGDFEPVKRHKDFRIFACMNPNTDIGKKDLTVGIRNRFTEFFVDELTTDADLSLLVSDYLSNTGIQHKSVGSIVKLYKKLKQMSQLELNDGLGNRPVYSLRTLCRALRICAKNLCGSIERNLYESFCLSFLTQLDHSSHAKVLLLIQSALVSNVKAVLRQTIPKPGDNYLNFEGYWIQCGPVTLQSCDNYILTTSVQQNLSDLARIISIGKLPVLLQGPTSAGKTSLIEYVARKSGNHCLRINNHEHTDLQEYIGSYAADMSGKLSFREGVLVQAMRHGYWIILDELNLASSDILEALNRVLDDNRELYIAETQTVVKAHANFMLFATQNPPGLYGGRKTLSRAFKNRFIELHFSDIPRAELEVILEKRCLIPASYAKKMVSCMSDLQKYRTTTSKNVFTLRDLFRWGNRYTYADKQLLADSHYDWNQHLIEEGYLVLSAKVRTEDEIAIIVQALYTNFRKRIELGRLFDTQNANPSPVTLHIIRAIKDFKKRTDIVWTRNMTRMAVLTAKAIQFNEPVLLVGPTGCGKTTICQLLADITDVRLRILNCHMHTEGADFLGGLRPCRQNTDEGAETCGRKLFEWANGPLIEAMQEGSYFMADEISLAEDSVLERLNCILEPERRVLLAEKGGMTEGNLNTNDTYNEFVVEAKEGFQFLATMNPGGDFGKKELSPALRNRFTEIWCLPSDSKEDLVQIASTCIIENHKTNETREYIESVAGYLVEVVLYIRDVMDKFKFSVRDILAWANFIVTNSQLSFPERAIFGLETIFLDALEMLPHESLDKVEALKGNIIAYAIKQADVLLQEKFTLEDITAKRGVEVIRENGQFGLKPFLIPIHSQVELTLDKTFMFEAPTTKNNLFRLLAALSLQKPLLLEGPPGVGKTSIVESLAKAIGYNIVRINLCEHTDISDLFGTDLPAEDNALEMALIENTNMDTSDTRTEESNRTLGSFVWRDGPLLAALKAPNTWILLDELNLAPQSVLEGLNAILDHRGEVYIPELNKTFALSKQTRIFACQNPLKQGGGRKGLPQSFLNRFNKVYLRKLTSQDLHFVIANQYEEFFASLKLKFVDLLKECQLPQADNLFDLYNHLKGKQSVKPNDGPQIDKNLLKLDLVARLVSFSERLDQGVAAMEFGYKGGPYEINLRDILRWCELLAHHRTGFTFPKYCEDFCEQFESFLLTLYERMKLVYYQRMRCDHDKAFIRNTFASVFECDAELLNQLSEDVCLYWTDENIYLNDVVLARGSKDDPLAVVRSYQNNKELSPLLLQSQREILKNIIECVHMEKPVLLCGSTDTGKTKIIDAVCTLSNQLCNTDTIDDSVTGSFQQIDLNRHLEEVSKRIETMLMHYVQEVTLKGNSLATVCKLLNAWSNFNMLTKSKPDTNNLSAMSDELKVFRQRLVKLNKVLELLLQPNKDFAPYAASLQQQQHILAALEKHVRQADSLNTGGSFEWVDSTIVKSLKSGQHLLLEHVNLCSSAVLDRLNPVFEPNGRLLISEKGVSLNETTEIVEKSANFRAFLTIDPKNGELSRAMRNRCIELALSKETAYTMDDMRHIVYAQGVHYMAAVKCILGIHERMQTLSEINHFNVSHLTQFVFLVKSYQHMGYDVKRAIYVSAMEVYVYAAHTDLLGYGLAYYQNQLREIVLEETQLFANVAPMQDVQLSQVLLNSSNLNAMTLLKLQMEPLSLLLQANKSNVQQTLGSLLSGFDKLPLSDFETHELSRFYIYMLYESSSLSDLDLRHKLLKNMLSNNEEFELFAEKLYACIKKAAKLLPTETAKLPWNCALMPRLRDFLHVINSTHIKNSYGLSATLLIKLLLQDIPVARTSATKLSQMTILEYSQAVTNGSLIDKLNNDFIKYLANFLQQMHNFLNDILQHTTMDAEKYAKLTTAYLWFNRLLQMSQWPLFVEKAFNSDLLDKLLLHFKWLKKHLLQGLQSNTHLNILDKLNAYALKARHPLNLIRKTFAQQMTHFQPYFLEEQLGTHQLSQQLDELLNVVPVYGTFTAEHMVRQYAAQKSVAAKRARAQLTQYAENAHNYVFKLTPLNEDIANILPLELQTGIKEFLGYMQQLKELELSAERHIDFEAIRQDIETLKQQILVTEDENNEEQVESTNKIILPLSDIEMRLLPLWQYYLTKAISNGLNNSHQIVLSDINDGFYESMPTLSCATLQLVKLLSSDKCKRFYLMWSLLQKHLPELEINHLIDYLNGSYREFATFARLLQNANYRQQLNSLATRVLCTHVLEDRDLEVSSRYVYEGPSFTNCLVSVLFNKEGKLKSMPLQDLDSWSVSLQQLRQLLWHNGTLMSKQYALSRNNLQLAKQNGQKLLKEVEYVREVCKEKLAEGEFEDFQQAFEKLVTSLDEELSRQSHDDCSLVLRESIKEEQMQYHGSILHALIGSLELCLLTFTPLIDPVEKQKLKTAYLDEDINCLKMLSTTYDCMRVVMHYKNFGVKIYDAFATQLHALLEQRDKCATKVAIRPEKCHYSALVQDITHFLHTNCNPVSMHAVLLQVQDTWRILHSHELNGEQLSGVTEVLSKLDLWIANSQRFVNHILKPYKAFYEDFLQPLQCAVDQMRFGFEGLKKCLGQVHAALILKPKSQRYINLNAQGRLHEILLNVVSFPSAQKLNIYDENSPRDIFKNRAHIFTMLEGLSNSERVYFRLLQAKLYEILQSSQIGSLMSEQDFRAYDYALHICNEVWQTEENQRQQQKAEEESLYVQKALCVEEDEELVELQEIAEHFPADIEADFGDFIVQDTLEKVMKLDKKPLKKKPSHVLGDEEYAFLAENFIQLMLQHTKVFYHEPQTAQQMELQLLAPFQQRLEVFVQLFGKYKTALNESLDTAVFNSFTLALGLQQQLLNEMELKGGSSINLKHYNYYKDANIPEVRSCCEILCRIELHVQQQLELYAEHATLEDILRIIERIRHLPASASLVRFNMGFQLLRQKIAQWNEVAHKGNHLRDEEIVIAEHVQRWTRLELQCWRNCLQQTEQKMAGQAYRYWFFIYNLLQEYFTQGNLDSSYTDIKHTEQRFGEASIYDMPANNDTMTTKVTLDEIVRIVRQFIEAANYGDFHMRLRLLHAFELYIHNVKNYIVEEDERLTPLIASLRNMQIYYAQFGTEISQTCKNMRAPIEKKLKEFVKIESYNKDLSYFSMRNNVARVHRQLNKFLREYRTQLQTKIITVFQPQDATVKDYEFHGAKDYETRFKQYKQPTQLFIAPLKLRDLYAVKTISETSVDNETQTLMQRVSKLFINSRNVVKNTVENSKYPQLIMCLDELLHGQLERCEHLRNLSVDRSREKPQQKVEAKQILQQKRKALIDLFKTLAELGVSYKSGLLELGLKTEFADFSLEPFCMKNMLPHSGKTVNLVKLSENLDTYYAKCVFKLRLLQNVMLTPLSELGPPTIERIKGCAVDLFLIVQKQRVLLAHSSKSMFDLRSGLENLRYLASACEKGVGMQNLSFANTRDTFVVLRESVCRMRFVFEQLQLVLNCAPSQQSTETQVFAIADARFLKQSSQFTKFEELCQMMLQLCKDTLQDMSTNDVEFLSLNKIKAYEETHGKLIELIKQLMTMLRASDNDAENYLPLAQPLQDLLIMAENAHEMEKVNNSLDIDLGEVETALEAVLHSVLMALQKLYKKYSETVEKDPSVAAQDTFENDVLEEQHLRKKLLEELSLDWEILNLPHIVQQLTHILLSLKHADVSDEKLIYCRNAVSMLPLLEQYQLMADFYLLQQLGSHRVSAKLLSALLTVFVEIGTKGFCVPPDLMQDEDGGKKGEQKEGEGFGLEDGTGEKDASDKLESEDQLDDAKRPEDRKNEEEKEDPDCKEEKGIEMSDDFDGKMQDVEKPENEEDDSGESEEEDELNKEMGETEDGAEKLDDQIWGDDEEPEEEEEEEKDMEEEDGKGSKDEKDSHNDLDSKNDAAKEDGKNNEEKEGLDATDEPSGDDRKKQEKDIDNMKDEQGDDEQTNPYHNELEEPPEPEEMELGDMNHDNEDDNEEGDEREDNENPFDIDRMKESMPAAEETPNDEEEAGEENTDDIKETEDNAGDSESEDEAGTELKEDVNAGEDEDENKQQEEETGEPETQKRGELEPEDTAEADEEKDEESHKEKPEDHAQSKDKSSKEENVQSVPDTDEKATADQVESEQNDKNVKQEEKLDEQDTGEEKDGVGQAENEEKDGGHKGIAETKETIARDDSKNERKPEEKRKQGKTDEERTLGEAEQNKLKQLKTIDKLKHENDKDNKDDLDGDKPEDEEMEAEEYQHIKEPKNSDRTTLDNATEDQSKQIKHQEDEEKKDDMEEEAENADELNADEDETMAVDDDVEEMKADKLEQKSEKPSKSSDKTKERAETQQEQVEIEGEYALTMDVSRGAETTAHCSKDLLLDTSQAEELSVAETLELRRKYQQQITTHLMTRPEHDDHETWQSVSQRMSQSARELCEQLRLILEPTKCTRLKGDYRTGRRINMKKIIPYIASQFRKDKIWLRRTKPAQRDYKITIAIDDSKSMHHNNSKTLTLEAISLVSQALTLLESGRLSVVSFGERPQIILNHTEQFDGPKLVSALNFEQDKTKIAELLDFMRTANAEEGLGGSDNGLFENLLLVLSDGRNIFGEGKLKVKNAIKLARLQRIFLVYIIIDNPENKNSILDIQTMEMLPDKRISIKSYLDDFPFPYYVIVRDLKQLPLVLSEAMRQWFELVNSEQ